MLSVVSYCFSRHSPRHSSICEICGNENLLLMFTVALAKTVEGTTKTGFCVLDVTGSRRNELMWWRALTTNAWKMCPNVIFHFFCIDHF